MLNCEDTLATFFATITGGHSRKACKMGLPSGPTLCNCGGGSPVIISLNRVARHRASLLGGGPLSSRHSGGMSEGPAVVGDTPSTFLGRVLEASELITS